MHAHAMISWRRHDGFGLFLRACVMRFVSTITYRPLVKM